MIGYYNYTMLLTYMSLASAGLGVLISLADIGHPYIGVFFLLFSGLCDAFDGKVARTKKNRSVEECKYGVQLDSLSDIVAFGVLPICIGGALMRHSEILDSLGKYTVWGNTVRVVLFTIMVLYLLAGLIRLAYFNVQEEMRQETEKGERKFYTGLPITSAAIIFPTVLLAQYIVDLFSDIDLMPVYFLAMTVTGLAFLLKFQLKKPGLKAILWMVAVGALEAIAMVVLYMTAGPVK